MYFDDFAARLGKDPLPRSVLFFGDAEGVLLEGLRSLKEAFKKSSPQGTVSVFDGAEDALADILSSSQNASLFKSEQLLVVQRAEKLLGGHSEEALARLGEYFSDPNPDNYLVFAASGLKKTVKAVAFLEHQGWAVQCSEMPEWKLVKWTVGRAQKAGLRITEEGAQALVEKTGGEMAYLLRALEQLSVYVHPRKEASLAEIQSLTIPGGETEIFSFLDEVGLRRTEKALRLLNALGGPSESGLVPMLYQRTRELLAIRLGQAKGMDQATLARELGLHPFRLKNLWEQAGQFSIEELKGALEDLIHLQMGQVLGRLGKAALGAALEWWLLKWGKNQFAVHR